jgi:LmbE family N-acetylglucosaminyl deacetylase
MKKIVLLLSITLFSLTNLLKAQAPPSWTSAEMYQAIKKLNVLGSVLYIAAHPDDENTRLISWLSKDRLYRTGYLSLTRGDGGQNLISDEQGIELGLIRTQELLAARRIDGGEQFFTRAYDFGFSKNPEETFTKWDKEKILSDVVWVIRKFQPDIIINRFPVTGEGGHGHHTASGILANEAFTAAADPKRFPEQLQYVSVWQAKRVLWNTFNFGGNNTQRDDQFKTDVGGYNPLLGKSYGEIAAESRSQHKSQGFGVPAGRGEALEYFKATKGDQPVTDLMDGVDLSWKRVPGAEAIEKMVNDLAGSFDFLNPEKSVKGLVQLYASMRNMPNSYWQQKKLEEVKQLIQQCSGLFMDATTSEQFAVKTDSIRVNLSFNNRLGANVVLKKVGLSSAVLVDSSFNQPLAKNRNFNYSKTIYVNPATQQTQPYWLEHKMEEGYFNVKEQTSIGQPDVDASIFLLVDISVEGQNLQFARPVKYKFTDPVRGELYQPLVVIPSVVMSPNEKLVISKGNNNFSGSVNVVAKKNNVSVTFGSIGMKDQDEPKYKFNPDTLVIATRNQNTPVNYEINANKDNEYFLFSTSTGNIAQVYYNLHEVKHDHIPYINYFTPVAVTNRKLDLKTFNKKIGYIPGAGDLIPEALEQMGYEVNRLTDKEMSKNNLDKFDAIITGVRAYNTNDWLNKHYDKLMKYVNDGGNLIVQYNTSNQIGPVRAKIGPYNFNITRTRVTDENAAVTFLKPEHPVFNFPNKITQDDFKGWVQERSIYHASDTSGKFEKLIGMSDPGEKSDDGSLIVAKYGKGWFTYTGIVFFRELPAGVPGAYRLLANIIALNKKKGF